MRKKHFKIVPIRKGEDTPCKECSIYWENNFNCSGNCQLIRRWRYILVTETFKVDEKECVITYPQIKGYIYKKI